MWREKLKQLESEKGREELKYFLLTEASDAEFKQIRKELTPKNTNGKRSRVVFGILRSLDDLPLSWKEGLQL